TGVSRLERRIGLDQAAELFGGAAVALDRDRLVQPGHGAVRGRERARATCIADRLDACAEGELRCATDRHRLQVRGVPELQHRDICRRVVADDARGVRLRGVRLDYP